MPKVEVDVNLEQLATILASLSPGDQETLTLLLDEATTEELLQRRAQAEQARQAGNLLTADELFME
jgi:hypothetical protein